MIRNGWLFLLERHIVRDGVVYEVWEPAVRRKGGTSKEPRRIIRPVEHPYSKPEELPKSYRIKPADIIKSFRYSSKCKDILEKPRACEYFNGFKQN